MCPRVPSGIISIMKIERDVITRDFLKEKIFKEVTYNLPKYTKGDIAKNIKSIEPNSEYLHITTEVIEDEENYEFLLALYNRRIEKLVYVYISY